MSLTLQLVNEKTLPDGGPVSFQISGKRGIDIGRAAHLDWTLPDPTRYVSSKHCEIRYKDGGYWLHDVSTNGTFLNGSANRMHAPHRLGNGDRFTVGHYIVAVTVEGAEEASEEASPGAAVPAAQAASDQQWWASEGDAPPPIDPKQLRSARQNAPVRADFLDWSADVPDPFQQAVADYPAPPSTRSTPTPIAPDMDWAEGPPSHVPTAPQSPPPAPVPRRPEESISWQETAPVAATPAPPHAAAGKPAEPINTLSLSTVESESSAAFVRQLAKSAGIAEELLAQKTPAELAQQIGTVLRLLTENLMQLLNARQEAKRLARSSSHTMIQAIDNNPLKFCPSADEALRIMFGPKSAGYLDAHRAITQGFEDLKAHQIKTYSAMQHALAMVMADLDPATIEGENEGGAGIGSLLQPRKAKVWDAYKARWEAKVGRKGGTAIEAFMRYFAEYYDRERG
jgi:type VI secretion system protein ImpI